MVKIRKNIVPKEKAKKVTYGGRNTKTYIVIHETDNTNKKANADAHARLQAGGNSRAASWHYQVDDKEVVQSFADSVQCWAAGNQHYNKHGIQVEICVNSDGDFKKAVNNAIKLTKHLMDKHNVPLKHVIRHHDASGKNCPRNLINGSKGITWDDFVDKLKGKSSGSSKPAPSKPNTRTNSIVDYLNSIAETSTYIHRKKLAEKHGIKNYTGTAEQNLKLLSILRDGKSDGPSKPKKSVSQMAKEVIAGKHGNGHVNRRKSLGISQSEYERVRAEGNRLASGKQPTKPSKPSFKVGSKVTVKQSAKRYATGEKIPARIKGKSYTIQQTKPDRVLLKEIYSWVRKSDLL